MQKRLLTFNLILIFAANITVQAQDTGREVDTQVELEPVPVSQKLLPYNNPMLPLQYSFPDSTEPDIKKMDDFQKEIMNQIAAIYRVHIDAIEAQVKDDPLTAEKYINSALSSLQELLDEYPEVQSNRRFNELYRSVMAEYREFYGIQDPAKQVEGEIFAIQKELFSGDDDWMDEGYVLPDNISMNKTDVPLVQNRQVNRHLMYYSLKRPEVMERWLERSEKYFPMMKKIFKEEGVPTELIHLSMIESGLNPTARSWAAAVGMWQFIRATGSMYGLEVNFWVDERRDPEKATRAAARHLKDLYNIWEDWHLAMANYNISPRGLRRAIRAAGGTEDYWAAYRYLPRETRGYVPGFIAATMIANNPVEFGFQNKYGVEPYDYEVAEVDPLMPLDELAKAAGITTEELKEYNPELLRWATPPGSKYSLKLPVGIKNRFMANYEDIPKESRSQNVAMHTVRRGETLGRIARKYGTSVRALYETNDNLSHIIYPGQKLVVPLAPGTNAKLAVNRPTHQPRGRTSTSSSRRSRASAPPNSSAVYYKVKKGDTIGHIAEWYDVRAWQIRAWNGTSNYIRPGERLVVYVPDAKENYYERVDGLSFAEKQRIEREQRSGKDVTRLYASTESSSSSGVTYTVRRNDTLSEIATSFGVSVSQIQQLNNLRGSRIYVGQTLRIK
ncbi:MAG: LysM peptidoglycan-binding domain-containing protein [Balneolaceae bacterium]|nr:LysM peptidoglycan-binding domain-containing protein [Balneolaceae bacterium]